VNSNDGNVHQIALYLLDWNNSSRTETISILDASTKVILDQRSFSGFRFGQWAVWKFKGNVLIQVTRTGGANAVVSGVLFD
jgi:hypothetical protein